ncbi:hypothetical protein PHLGIDRAFT_99307 [Phlebiopsis gigantea 11061_1 CR5-6]|uniref:Sister chromatid cohesion protein DCC1 n=1 Tax=Phlebiopsis gigantea (strain 11061_1 CR5-6) TaxID=745531 RepID=A0A0C3S5X1_PHLG1|nr:hypothetical protein PHLGIDRAFT_99307 [Phlebiopsis gigantea 11061_1 CR5-6]
MVEFNLRLTTNSAEHSGSYRILELPPDIHKLIDSTFDGNAGLSIKGNKDEDAVLCTLDKTYALRSVVLSNSVLVVTPPVDASGDPDTDVVIQDTIHEVLELVPTLPRLQRLNGMLRGREYDEGHDEDEDIVVDDSNGHTRSRSKLTYDDARSMLQASELELALGLRDRHILILDGELRPLASSYLTAILEFLLTALVSYSLSHHSAPTEQVVTILEQDHEVRSDVTRQVMGWFGEFGEDSWKMNVAATVREVGLGILRAFRNEPIVEDQFLAKWRAAVGDTFESSVDLILLLGNYLTNRQPLDETAPPLLTYFPASDLPSDPAGRFADLFLTRARWKAEEISPFLSDIVVDNKERDKLLLKYARGITDSQGIWYTARAKQG